MKNDLPTMKQDWLYDLQDLERVHINHAQLNSSRRLKTKVLHVAIHRDVKKCL